MVFKGFQKLSLIEWPGKICSVVFVSGCNFRCPWCYNQDLVWHPEKLPDIDEKEILEYLAENKHLLEGVMITGGEPLASRELPITNYQLPIFNFIKKVKEMGLGIGIETNGSNPEAIECLIKNNLVDYFAMDIKAPLEQKKYNQLTGLKIDLDKIKKSVKIIKEKARNRDYEFRTTVVPGLLDENDILEIAEYIKGAKRYYLQQFYRMRINTDNDADRDRYISVNPRKNQCESADKEFFNKLSTKIKNYFPIFGIR